MKNDNDLKRLSRLTAILTQLQTKRFTNATSLALKFNVSIRTIYRDIHALEQSGIPILSEDGKGYYLMDGYRLPPVSFTEKEANALVTAEKLVLNNKDDSFLKEYISAIEKIKSLLQQSTKENIDLLSSRTFISRNYPHDNTSDYLTVLQLALTNFNLVRIDYLKPDCADVTVRTIEPFALLSTQGNWLLLAWCRLRKDFRFFRLDRITNLTVQDEKFKPHNMTLQDFFEQQVNNYNTLT